MPEVIDIFAAFRTHETRRASGGRSAPDRLVFEFRAPDVVFSVDEKPIAELAAKAIEAQLRDNLVAGRAPDGTPLPTVSAATLERRRYREEQARRGGELTPRIKDPKVRARGLKSWRRRFVAAALGAFTPGGGGMPRGRWGLESGMLAKSPRAIPQADGSWKVFFAGARANLDGHGMAPIQRVFRRISMWSAAAMRQPKIQEALRKVKDTLLTRRVGAAFGGLAKLAGQLVGAAAQEPT